MIEFDWDEGTLTKLEKVRVSGRNFTIDEVESVFTDPNRVLVTSYPDEKTGEPRYRATGLSNQNRVISVIFVLRDGQIRIFNVWQAKQTALKKYHGQTTDIEAKAAVRTETNNNCEGDQSSGE